MNTKPKNIVLITDTVFDSNGVSRFISDMAKYAPEFGSRFSVITSSPLREYGASNNILNIKSLLSIQMPYYKEQSISLIPPFWKILRKVRELKPDVIHISTPGSLGISAIIIARLLGVRAVGTYHTDFPGYMYKNTGRKSVLKVATWYMQIFYHRLDRVFVRSKQNLKLLEEDINIDARYLAEILAGTDTDAFSPSFASQSIWENYGIDKEAVKLLFVGRLSVEKNFDLLLELFQRYRTGSNKEVILVVVGEGDRLKERDTLKEQGVFLLGRKEGEELSSIYASSDLLLFPSVTETLGQVVMEAAASALPAVVSTVGGVTQSVEHGVNGYCIDVEDEMLWLEKIDELVCNETLRREMGREGRKKMEQRSIKASCEQFLQQHDF